MRRTVSGENVRWRERKPPLRRWNLNLRRALPHSKMSAREVEKRIKGEVARWDDYATSSGRRSPRWRLKTRYPGDRSPIGEPTTLLLNHGPRLISLLSVFESITLKSALNKTLAFTLYKLLIQSNVIMGHSLSRKTPLKLVPNSPSVQSQKMG